MTPEIADGGAHAAGDRLRELAQERAAEKHDMFRGFSLGHYGNFSTCPQSDCRLVRDLVPVPPQITVVKLTDEQAVSALCILDGCQHMKAVPPAPSGALRWYPCACGAEHDTPTCPFGVAAPAPSALEKEG